LHQNPLIFDTVTAKTSWFLSWPTVCLSNHNNIS